MSELHETLKRGLEDSAEGRVFDTGSFAKYADDSLYALLDVFGIIATYQNPSDPGGEGFYLDYKHKQIKIVINGDIKSIYMVDADDRETETKDPIAALKWLLQDDLTEVQRIANLPADTRKSIIDAVPPEVN